MNRPPARSRRWLGAAAAAGIAVPLLSLGAPPATADGTTPGTSARTPAGTTVLTSGALDVVVAKDFPRVVRYTDRTSGATLGGQPRQIDTVVLNGTAHTAKVHFSREGERAAYRLTFDELPGVQLDAELSVQDNVLTFRVTKVTDTSDFRVHTISIPHQSLLSVSSEQAGAKTAFTKVDVDSTRNADRHTTVTASTPAEDQPTGATYAILNTDEVAASIENNSTYDHPSGQETMDGARFWHQAVKDPGGATRVGVSNGEWTYRGDGAPFTSELPWAKVVIGGDANDDGAVDWQDGAIAFRAIGVDPKGADEVPDRVIQHIPFNIGSQATHPFLRTLDDVKRLALATDGLGQWALLKGYQNEGHDSAHPDYWDVGERQGGLKDLNTLLKGGAKYGADFAVHVNTTEAYPEAKSFGPDLIRDSRQKGWNWFDQSYYIDWRRDLTSGALLQRMQRLRDETNPNLKMLYIDAYYPYGWLPDELDHQLTEQGWQISTEWASHMERSSLWSHWATDRNYGGKTNKGINSTIIRFIRNAQKDVWNPAPILGGSTIVEAEGWTGHHDWNALVRNVWENQLPTKFLQQHQIRRWTDHEIDLTDGVRGTDRAGVRKLYVGDAQVLDGDAYLLPWASTLDDPNAAPDKLYHYNADGGETTWQLTDRFSGVPHFRLYRLDDTGRHAMGTVTPVDGKVTLHAKAGTAYVLVPVGGVHGPHVDYGVGTGLQDPGFNRGDLSVWKPHGDAGAAVVGDGFHVARLGAGPGSIHQRITGLRAGERYAASAWVQVEPGHSRPTTVSVVQGGKVLASRTVDRSTAPNATASDEKLGTWFQRVRVLFTAPHGAVDLKVATGDGAAPVLVDDARVVATTEPAPGDDLVRQDFEGNDEGFWPFVTGPADDGGDGRSHRSQKHAPYTQAGWNGKLVDDVIDGDWSLKAHEEHRGINWRTWQGSVDFQPSHRYRVSFDYENAHAGAYAWVTVVDQVAEGRTSSVVLDRVEPEQQRTPGHVEREFTTGNCGSYWVGLERLSGGGAQSDFILDNLRITDLGESDEAGACASLDVDAGDVAVGEDNEVTTTFTNHETTAATGVEQQLQVPSGWTVDPVGSPTTAAVAPGATASVTWQVHVPADADGSYDLRAAAHYTAGGTAHTVTGATSVHTLPAGLIPQSHLRVVDVDSQETEAADGRGSNAIDGNTSTMWHSQWYRAQPGYPHHITIDLGDTYDVNAFDYQVRVGNGAIKDYELYVSADGNDWGQPVATGSFRSTTDVQHLTFPATTGRYVKLVGLSSINGRVFGGAGELNVWGTRAREGQ